MEVAVSYMSMDKAKIRGIQSKARKPKKQDLWTYVYLHPENQIVHDSRSMPLQCVS